MILPPSSPASVGMIALASSAPAGRAGRQDQGRHPVRARPVRRRLDLDDGPGHSARLVRIDPAANAITRRMPVGTRPFGLAYGAGSVWVADRSINRLARVNPRTNKVVKRITIGYASYGVALRCGQRLGDERERRDRAADQPERRTGSWRRSGSGTHAERRRLRVRRDLGRRPRRRRVLRIDPTTQPGDRRGSPSRRPTGSRRRRMRSGSRARPARSSRSIRRRGRSSRGSPSARTRSRPRGSAASCGCRTSTTGRSRSSIRQRTASGDLADGKRAALGRVRRR